MTDVSNNPIQATRDSAAHPRRWILIGQYLPATHCEKIMMAVSANIDSMIGITGSIQRARSRKTPV
jgi:hypothetical protein